MILFNFVLINPWHKNKFKSLYNKSWLIYKHKAIEFEIIYADYEVVEARFEFTFRQDHAGMSLTLGLFGYSVNLQFYDTRHWNIEKGAWETYDDDNINS